MFQIHENAQELRRIWKSMKEAQEMGQLLNQRQKLFGATVVPWDDLNKLLREFEPYKNLWITASGQIQLPTLPLCLNITCLDC